MLFYYYRVGPCLVFRQNSPRLKWCYHTSVLLLAYYSTIIWSCLIFRRSPPRQKWCRPIVYDTILPYCCTTNIPAYTIL